MGHKKLCNLSGQQKNSHNLLGQKNHAISPDNKKSRYFSGQKKSHNLSGQKIIQHLETKKSQNPLGQKKSHNLSGQKPRNLWDKIKMQSLGTKKIMLSRGPIVSELVHKAPNGIKFVQIGPNKLE